MTIDLQSKIKIRQAISDLPGSKIREISKAAFGRPGLIPLWFGEGDEPTPSFIRDAAKASLDRGETFYSPNNGLPLLRQAIAQYMSRLYGKTFDQDRITITASGMNAIMLTSQLLMDAGDNMVLVEPMWPNARESVRIMGAEPRAALLHPSNNGWRLDLDHLFAQCDARTRAIFVNSPGNPTGWMMDQGEQHQLLDFARKRGIWIVADEVYNRIVYDRTHAPSFLEIADDHDPVIVINSFSKAWSMTGWRLGWITAPANLLERLAVLTEFNTSHATTFVQHAGIAAIERGETYIERLQARYGEARVLTLERLQSFKRIRLIKPDAAFYAFFAVEGVTDSFSLAQQILAQTNVGLAPGVAFGPAGEGYIRLCYACSITQLKEALDRLEPILA